MARSGKVREDPPDRRARRQGRQFLLCYSGEAPPLRHPGTALPRPHDSGCAIHQHAAAQRSAGERRPDVVMAIAGKVSIEGRLEKIPATMQAAVYRGKNDDRMETVPVPDLSAGELLLRVHTCGICGTDLKKIATGSHSAPRIFGHETSGEIAAIGNGVPDFKVGNRVVASPIWRNGSGDRPGADRYHISKTGAKGWSVRNHFRFVSPEAYNK